MNVDISPKRPPISSWTAAAPSGSGSDGGGNSDAEAVDALDHGVAPPSWVVAPEMLPPSGSAALDRREASAAGCAAARVWPDGGRVAHGHGDGRQGPEPVRGPFPRPGAPAGRLRRADGDLRRGHRRVRGLGAAIGTRGPRAHRPR